MKLESLHSQLALYKEIANETIVKPYKNSQNTSSKSTGNTSTENVPTKSDASVVDLSNQAKLLSNLDGNISNQELYKHISDYNSGEGHLSRNTGNKLANKELKIASALKDLDPSVALLYSGYRTLGKSYGNGARSVRQLSSSIKESNTLRKLGEELKRNKL